jgi:glycyl-radical enzyme activating protein
MDMQKPSNKSLQNQPAEDLLVNTTGMVFDMKKFATNDGPGIRTTVFLKGCPLHCLWCHNPQSIDRSPEISYDAHKCTMCGACAEACPVHCHRIENGAHTFSRMNCLHCGACASACTQSALQIVGTMFRAGDIIAEVLKDRHYYEESGGGMTISGGEPMLQPQFTGALLAIAASNGIHICLDTCGNVAFRHYMKILPFVNMVRYDIKETDPERHRQFTGVDKKLILENLLKLDALNIDIVLTCPIIPGYNDRPDHFAELARLASMCRSVKEVNVLPFHPYGCPENLKSGRENPMKGLEPVDEDTAMEWVREIQSGTEIPVLRG